MKRLLYASAATGVAVVAAVGGVLLVANPFGGSKAVGQGVAAVRPPAVDVPAAPPESAAKDDPAGPPVSAAPLPTEPSTKPTRSAAPPRSTPPATKQPQRVDAAAAAAIVRERFVGARVLETELDDGQWELHFLHKGVENEIKVDPRTGRLSEHEIED